MGGNLQDTTMDDDTSLALMTLIFPGPICVLGMRRLRINVNYCFSAVVRRGRKHRKKFGLVIGVSRTWPYLRS